METSTRCNHSKNSINANVTIFLRQLIVKSASGGSELDRLKTGLRNPQLPRVTWKNYLSERRNITNEGQTRALIDALIRRSGDLTF